MKVRELIASLKPHRYKVFEYYPEANSDSNSVSITWQWEAKEDLQVQKFINELSKFPEDWNINIGDRR